MQADVELALCTDLQMCDSDSSFSHLWDWADKTSAYNLQK